MPLMLVSPAYPQRRLSQPTLALTAPATDAQVLQAAQPYIIRPAQLTGPYQP
jgi:hypothetical protein